MVPVTPIMKKIRSLLRKILTPFTFLTLLTSIAHADITVIVPFNKGGDSTVAAESQTDFFKKYFNENLNVVHQPSMTNRPGTDGWESLNSLKDDGKTIMVVNVPTIILQPLLYQNVKYKTEDLSIFVIFQAIPNGLIVKDSSRFNSLNELIDYAKKHPDELTAGGVGYGGIDQLMIEQLNKEAGIKIKYTSFTGQAGSENALLEKQIDVLSGAVSSSVRLGAQARTLAFGEDKRLSMFPDVPTFKELKLNIISVAYRGYAAPKTTALQIKDDLSQKILKINHDPEFIKKIESLGFIVKNIPLDSVPAFMNEQIKLNKPLINLIPKQ
jgi:tripartite-type tricarboxylate transporter receptor subunit TctC